MANASMRQHPGVNPDPKLTRHASEILFFDGACGLCNNTVRFVLDHERTHTLRFATLQGAIGESLLRKYPHLQGVDSIVLLIPARGGKDERVLVRSDAALHVANYMGGFWRLSSVAYLLPRRFRDAVYDFLARHRHRISSLKPSCTVSHENLRGRFLDTESSEQP